MEAGRSCPAAGEQGNAADGRVASGHEGGLTPDVAHSDTGGRGRAAVALRIEGVEAAA